MPLPPFHKLNDLCRLAVDFANEIYYFDDDDADDPPTERTFRVVDHPDAKIGTGTRDYRIKCLLFSTPINRELACLYLAEYDDLKFAFIAWKGTNSFQQCLIDLTARYESPEAWKNHLQTICEGFLTPLSAFLDNHQINAKDYEWYTTGHSLGGALSAYSGYLLECNPQFINGGTFLKSFTFAGMLLPTPLPLPPLVNEALHADESVNPEILDYVTCNKVIAFYNQHDRLVEFASQSMLQMIGHPKIDINYLTLDTRMYHLLVNYVNYLQENYIIIEDQSSDIINPDGFRIIHKDERMKMIFTFDQGLGEKGIQSLIL